MHCLTVTHGMQEFTSPQSVDVSVKTLKEDLFSSTSLIQSVATTSSFLPFNSIPFYLYNTKTTVISRCLPSPFLFFVFISPYLHQLSPHCGGKKNNNYFKELQHLTCNTTSSERAGTVYEI